MPRWLTPTDLTFPDPVLESDAEGLVAIGGDLGGARLLEAYRNGIFPWFRHHNEPYWFCPDPRAVLLPHELRVTKSMRPIFNQQKFRYSIDTRFKEVVENCRDVWRKTDLQSSWIDAGFVAGYLELHEMGYAHSVEVWEGEELVGGLYGVSIGRCFYGESMFSFVPNASKAGLIKFVEYLKTQNFWLIDCQVTTDHLASLGAREIPRSTFLEIIKKNAHEASNVGKWEF
jgi:leucyl/phenylalanyl-tRNA---protein transferase